LALVELLLPALQAPQALRLCPPKLLQHLLW
jgi:hypothetical protein